MEFQYAQNSSPPPSSSKEQSRFFGLTYLNPSETSDYQSFSKDVPDEYKEIFSSSKKPEQVGPSLYSPYKQIESAKIKTNGKMMQFDYSNIQEVQNQTEVDETFLERISHIQINNDLSCYEEFSKIRRFLPDSYKGLCPFCNKYISYDHKNEDAQIGYSGIRSKKLKKIFICHPGCVDSGILENYENSQLFFTMQSEVKLNLQSNAEKKYTDKFIAAMFNFKHTISKESLLKAQQILPVYLEKNIQVQDNESVNWKIYDSENTQQPISNSHLILPTTDLQCNLSFFTSFDSRKHNYQLLINLSQFQFIDQKKILEIRQVVDTYNNSEVIFGCQLLTLENLDQKSREEVEKQYKISELNLPQHHVLLKIIYFKFSYKVLEEFPTTIQPQPVQQDVRYSKTGKQLPYLQSNVGFNNDEKFTMDQNSQQQQYIFQKAPVTANLNQINFQGNFPNNGNNNRADSPQLLSAGKPPRTIRQNVPVRFNSDHNLRNDNIIYYAEEEKDSVNESVTQSPNKAKSSHFKDFENNGSLNSIDQDQLSPNRMPGQSAFGQSQDMEDVKEFKDIQGQILLIARTNSGSRTLQRFFHQCSQTDVDKVLEEIYDSLPELVTDSYGNYMFQSLIQVATVEQRCKILEKIAFKIPRIVLDKKGTHAMQTLVSMINITQEVELIIKNITNKVEELSKHNNATHFLQKIIVCFDSCYLDFIYEAISRDIVYFGNDPHCLCVLKALMTKYKSEQNDERSKKIIRLLAQKNDLLIQSPYGNYAIQHAFECHGEDMCQEILQKILQKLTQFSIQKYSSNVIEKCVSAYSQEFKHQAIDEIIKSETISEFMKNKYGNFILHKLLMLGEEQKGVLVLKDLIKKNINNIHIQKFKNKWQSYLQRSDVDPHLFSEGMHSPSNCSSPTLLHHHRKPSGNHKKMQEYHNNYNNNNYNTYNNQ